MRIGEVEIISMLMPLSPSVVNTLAATPGWVFIPAPTIDTFPIDSSVASDIPSSLAIGSSAVRAAWTSSRGTVNDMSARSPSVSGSPWTIMSMFTFAAASAVVTRPATPGVSGTPMRGGGGPAQRVGDGGDQRLFHGVSLGDDNSTRRLVEARPAVDAHAVVARVLDAAQLQHAGARGGHLEHLVERDDRQLARVGDDARVGAEDARHVGVDLAHLGTDGGSERDRGGVAPPAP